MGEIIDKVSIFREIQVWSLAASKKRELRVADNDIKIIMIIGHEAS